MILVKVKFMNPDVNPDYKDIRVYPAEVQETIKNYSANGFECVSDRTNPIEEKATGKILLQFRRRPGQSRSVTGA